MTTKRQPLPPAMASMRSVLQALRALLRLNIHVSGRENLVDDRPTLFVCNHFTRMETAILPWVLYEVTGKVHASLADKELFSGAFGRWLRAAQVLPTNDPERNAHIMHDLVTNNRDWVIYPEGWMVKSRRVIENGELLIDVPQSHERRFPHTGAAAIALQAALSRRQLQHRRRGNDLPEMMRLREQLGIASLEECSEYPARIVPVSMTYYPLRAGDNAILRIAEMTGGKKGLPRRLVEELSVEGSMLTQDTDLHIHIGEPIDLDAWVDARQDDLDWHSEEGANTCIDAWRWDLTEQAMRAIYGNGTVNLDHVLALIIRYYPHHRLSDEHLRYLIVLSALQLSAKGANLHPHLQRGIILMASDHDAPAMESALACAIHEGVMHREGEAWIFPRDSERHTPLFESIRIDHPMTVLANEAEAMTAVKDVVWQNCLLDREQLHIQLHTAIIAYDRSRYRRMLRRYQGHMGKTNALAMGAPKLLTPSTVAPGGNKRHNVGVVLAHGYLSQPAEVAELGELLRQAGIQVYLPRLAGHGTSPDDLAETDWEDWYASYVRGLVALHQTCDQVVAAGFSTGGLLALMAAAKNPHMVSRFVAINAPLQLHDNRAKWAPWVDRCNNFLNWLGLPPVWYDVANESERPQINYDRNPIHGGRDTSP